MGIKRYSYSEFELSNSRYEKWFYDACRRIAGRELADRLHNRFSVKIVGSPTRLYFLVTKDDMSSLCEDVPSTATWPKIQEAIAKLAKLAVDHFCDDQSLNSDLARFGDRGEDLKPIIIRRVPEASKAP